MATLYLIPNFLSEGEAKEVFPQSVLECLQRIHHYIVEDERNFRRFFRKCGISTSFDSIHMELLSEHTAAGDYEQLLKPLLEGNDLGLVSDAGCPGIADPGEELVLLAHSKHIKVKPLIGPSSILLSLIASGLNAENFAFNGYLPVKNPDRIQKIKKLEIRAKSENQTQIFIETPYRNLQLLEDIIQNCSPEMYLSIAADINAPEESIITKKTKEWKNKLPDIHKHPAVFAIGF